MGNALSSFHLHLCRLPWWTLYSACNLGNLFSASPLSSSRSRYCSIRSKVPFHLSSLLQNETKSCYVKFIFFLFFLAFLVFTPRTTGISGININRSCVFE